MRGLSLVKYLLLISSSVCGFVATSSPPLPLCFIANRSDPSKIPPWAQIDKSIEVWNFDDPIGANEFITGDSRESYSFSLANGKLHLASKVGFDGNYPSAHIRLFKATYTEQLPPNSRSSTPSTGTFYVYLKDNQECLDQRKGSLPSNIGTITKVEKYTTMWKPGQ